MSDDAMSIGSYEETWGLCNDMWSEQMDLAAAAPLVALNRESAWRTKTGQKIPVKDMSDSHILRTIVVLQGRSPAGTTFTCSDVRRREWLNVLCNEAYRRGLTPDVLPADGASVNTSALGDAHETE